MQVVYTDRPAALYLSAVWINQQTKLCPGKHEGRWVNYSNVCCLCVTQKKPFNTRTTLTGGAFLHNQCLSFSRTSSSRTKQEAERPRWYEHATSTAEDSSHHGMEMFCWSFKYTHYSSKMPLFTVSWRRLRKRSTQGGGHWRHLLHHRLWETGNVLLMHYTCFHYHHHHHPPPPLTHTLTFVVWHAQTYSCAGIQTVRQRKWPKWIMDRCIK